VTAPGLDKVQIVYAKTVLPAILPNMSAFPKAVPVMYAAP
jgi:hypothetical protein